VLGSGEFAVWSTAIARRKTMRKFALLAAVLGLFSFSAAAQDYPMAEFFGGYQFTHLNPNVNANGWNISVTEYANSWFGVKGDFSGAYKSEGNLHTFMFGPVFALRKAQTVSPFAHALVGVAYLSDGRATTGLSMAVGGGLDVKVNQHFAVRIVQADWLPFRVGSDWVKQNARISTGLVWRW
jgi:opacity protein-like surface antigen